MSKTSNQLQEALDNGWSVQVYSRDRRLLCSLYPSHGWAFLMGIVLGFVVALVSLSGQVSTQSSHTAQSSSAFTAPIAAPFALD
jgi:hypothetical protein